MMCFLVFPVSVRESVCVGGEGGRGEAFFISGHARAQCIGNLAAYLEPNSNSLQKPIGGRSKIPKGGRSVLAFSAAINGRIRLL